ncbi:hypothetical protein B7P43_G18118 [Cryptotermes secundus]|uniref:Uncharacterized protein n=1 Tax=Cryptotermes secundus TaxID=105785 RepID=A0A2J7PPB9_9NEOP|nr:hypothetical protein B7P43_G18118 [Cryptotermes secundus]
MDKVADDVAVGPCIAVLKGIFDKAAVPHFQETIVILWRTNSRACVSLPFVVVRSAEDDPVQVVKCRHCFAGEHTISNYPTTAHGPLVISWEVPKVHQRYQFLSRKRYSSLAKWFSSD